MINNVNIIGRLVAAPIPFGSGDKICARFTVAVPHVYKDADGNRGADFVDCVAFGRLADTILAYVGKGDRVGVSGRLSVGSYTDKNGVKRRSWSVVAEHVAFCDVRKAPERAPELPPAPATDPAAGAQSDVCDYYPF